MGNPIGNLSELEVSFVCVWSGGKKNTLLVEQGIFSLFEQLGHELCAEL